MPSMFASTANPEQPSRTPGWITDAMQSALIDALETRRRRRHDGDAPMTIPAAVVARWLRVPGVSRETRRRRVRELVASLRARGVQVCATEGACGGYYLPISAGDLIEERERRRRGGLARLVGASEVDRSCELADARGQLALFAVA
jgi:hypothetical protein